MRTRIILDSGGEAPSVGLQAHCFETLPHGSSHLCGRSFAKPLEVIEGDSCLCSLELSAHCSKFPHFKTSPGA